MLKNILLTVFISSYIFANSFKISDQIGSFSLPDQFDKMHIINQNIQTILVSFEKGTSTDINRFLASKEADYLNKHKSVFIANITDMPSFITRLFAIPKMRKYKHKILLINNEHDDRFIFKDDKITVYKLEHGIIKDIYYIDSNYETLKKAF